MHEQHIVLKKVHVHNLKFVDLTLPKNELIVFTGVSGSGKSSLAFETLYVEGQRRYLESMSTYLKRQIGDFAKPAMESAEGLTPTISIEQKAAGHNPRSTVGTMTEIYDYLRVLYARVAVPYCPVSGKAVSPQSRERIIKTVQIMPAGCKILILAPYVRGKKGEYREDFQELIRKGFTRVRVDGNILSLADEIALDGHVSHDIDVVIDRLTVHQDNSTRIAESITAALDFGQGVCTVFDTSSQTESLFSMHAYSQDSGLSYTSLEPHDFSFNSPLGMCTTCCGLGIIYDKQLLSVPQEGRAPKSKKIVTTSVCPICQGSRLKSYPAAARFAGKTIAELTALTIQECAQFFDTLALPEQELLIAGELLKEIKQRLKFLLEVGLHYLSLSRTAPTLSGGEAQRVRLAAQIGGALVGITYILDEPSIGLHPRDNSKLIDTLKHLRNMGNTVIVVEHDEETIWEADRIVDVGPGPGSRGGQILVNGSVADLLDCPHSITGQYLSGKLQLSVPKRRKVGQQFLEVIAARHHNLKNISVAFPLGLFIAVTGVSGSGKSSLVTDILHPALANQLHAAELLVGEHEQIRGMEFIDKVIGIDQSPIGRTPRSNPATYIKLFDDIRDLFSSLPESQARGYKAGRFSFNVKEGSCPHCSGMGMIEIDMDFMEAAWSDCPLCQRKRFDSDTLAIYYKGKNIYDILEMEVAEALEFFQHIPSIRHKLETLKQVGLEYIKLGQSSTTLSGGEAQRIKLAKELVRPATGRTFYILDEPTTGLHFHDIQHLLTVLHELVDRGNTVLVIEHNMDVVKNADWVIDLGPEGGKDGGRLIATGTPEKISKMNTPTALAIKAALSPNTQAKITKALASKKAGLQSPEKVQQIKVRGAAQNNLKHLDVCIPRDQVVVCTGPSGSGKSSFAFETIYAEGQRRYTESLSPYARQFVKQSQKPKVIDVEGLSPAVAIEQKAHAGNPRSTVGTMTEIYDYLRVLYACIGVPHSPTTGEPIRSISKDFVVERLMLYPEGEKIQILAPIHMRKNESFSDIIHRLSREGFLRIRLNDKYLSLDEPQLESHFERKRKNELYLVIDRIKIDKSQRQRLSEAVERAASIGGNKLLIARTEGDVLFNLAFAVESNGESFKAITPHTFAFNTAEGMCPDCLGLGYQYGANLAGQGALMEQTLLSLIYTLWGPWATSQAFDLLEIVLKQEKIRSNALLSTLSSKQLQLIMNGSEEGSWYISPQGFKFQWMGINAVLAKAGRSASVDIREAVQPILHELPCLSCQGARINALARHVTIEQLAIHHVCALSLARTLSFIKELSLPSDTAKVVHEVIAQLIARLSFLVEIGLPYLTLDRRAPTLSGGEAQRIRLARQLGSGLTGVLYVLDEPTIGLHPRDSQRLNLALRQLKELGNSLIMVEHDLESIAKADYILDFGPQAGIKGGHIVAQGTPQHITTQPDSLTGAYLSGKMVIPLPQKRRKASQGMLTIKNARAHNLKDLQLNIPLGILTVFTGVSGSGKSTLMNDLILPAVKEGLLKQDVVQTPLGCVSGISHFDKLIDIDQNPIGHTIRSTVGTYVDILTPIRYFFASLPQARIKGLQPKHFSYNHRRGMCSACWGLGHKKVEMHFLPSVKVTCEACRGLRLNPLSLEITYGGKSLGQWLDVTIDEARVGFAVHPRIVKLLDTLIAVGLGYLKLGQEVATLSGGEAQRLRLSRELAKRATGKTLFLIDEPTTGLHSDDIVKLLKVLHRLVDQGNTMILIEHHLDVIRNADFIVDLGPEAGEGGGEIVCTGTPEEVALHATSWTGRYLRGEEQKEKAVKKDKKI